MTHGTLWLAEAICIQSVCCTNSLFERMRGLIGYRELGAQTGLLIERCAAVHTVGMRFTLDLVFLDAAWRIVKVVPQVRPGHLCISGGARARRVVEVESGWLDPERVPLGATLRWEAI